MLKHFLLICFSVICAAAVSAETFLPEKHFSRPDKNSALKYWEISRRGKRAVAKILPSGGGIEFDSFRPDRPAASDDLQTVSILFHLTGTEIFRSTENDRFSEHRECGKRCRTNQHSCFFHLFSPFFARENNTKRTPTSRTKR